MYIKTLLGNAAEVLSFPNSGSILLSLHVPIADNLQ